MHTAVMKPERTIDVIYLHCTATEPYKPVPLEVIRRWHVEGRGWSDIGYHYIIQPDGKLEFGRDVNIAGAHVKGDNKTSIGVCMVGNWDEAVPEPDHIQIQVTGKLLAILCKTCDIKPESYGLLLHREAHLYRLGVPNPHKSCPGANIEGRPMRLFVQSIYNSLYPSERR